LQQHQLVMQRQQQQQQFLQQKQQEGNGGGAALLQMMRRAAPPLLPAPMQPRQPGANADVGAGTFAGVGNYAPLQAVMDADIFGDAPRPENIKAVRCPPPPTPSPPPPNNACTVLPCQYRAFQYHANCSFVWRHTTAGTRCHGAITCGCGRNQL
jgi:hypothetical protein